MNREATMSKLLKILPIAFLAVFTGCLDTVQSYNGDTSVDVVAKVSDLPDCTKENEGAQVFVKSDSAARICMDGRWQFLGTVYTTTVKANTTCSVKNLKDGSGVKIICNGDSIGVVLNGEVGDQGDQGAKGATGKAGATGDKGATGAKGDKGATGKDGTDGTNGPTGDKGVSCTVNALDDSSGFRLMCGTDSVGVLTSGRNGTNGKDCTVESMADSSGYKVLCGADSMGVLLNGQTGLSCGLSKFPDGTATAILCGGDTVTVLGGGEKLGLCTKWRELEVMYLNEKYYVCHDGAWGEATVIEFDTFGYGDAPDGQCRVGRVNKDTYYVYVDGKWQNSTIIKDLGACETENENTVGKSGDYYYICKSKYWTLATVAQYDTYGKACGEDGSLVAGIVNTSLKYVCDAGEFRIANETEVSFGKGCTNYTDKDKISQSGVDYYCRAGKWIVGLLDSRDNQVYRTVKIGNQTWMAENLNYADSVKSPSLKGRQWCYNNKADNCAKYGRLYTWSAAMDSVKSGCGYNGCSLYESLPTQGICPDGWHVPSNSEWDTLFNAVGGSGVAGRALMSAEGWNSSYSLEDKYGFSVLPAGQSYQGESFDNLNYNAYFWTASESDVAAYYAKNVYFESSYKYASQSSDHVYYGKSLRCVKDYENKPTCNADNEGVVARIGDSPYTCHSMLWRPSTDLELDTEGLTCANDGSIVSGVLNSDNKYICTAGRFRFATELEIALGQGCPSGDGVETATIPSTDFYCESGYVKMKDARDNQFYKVTKVGSLTWMAENLNYADSVTTPSLMERQWCYDSKSENCAKYGRLYTWAAAMDSANTGCGYQANCTLYESVPARGICPVGWHVPSNAEWDDLYNSVGGSSGAATKLKSVEGWGNGYNGSDRYGFTALPGGYNDRGTPFAEAGRYAYFWAKSADYSDAYYAYFDGSDSYAYRSSSYKYYGRSLRCVKDTVSIPVCNAGNEGLITEIDETSYTCRSSLWVKTTDVEFDTYGLTCKNDGSLVSGINNVGIKYICTAGKFRYATELEISFGKGCPSGTGTTPTAITSAGYYCESGYIKMKDARDNKYYKVTSIGSQVWMAENLNYADSAATPSLKKRNLCYGNNADNCDKYGRYYTWSAVMDSVNTGCGYQEDCPLPDALPAQGICPEGWHVPSYSELYTLYSAVGGSEIAGKKLKTDYGWGDYNGTDRYGFSAMPVGYNNGGTSFEGVGSCTNFWLKTSDYSNSYYAYFCGADNYGYSSSDYKYNGRTLRCLKDDVDRPSCAANNEGNFINVSGTYYKCHSSLWREATEKDADVNGLTCNHNGTILSGVVNSDNKYVCDADTFRYATPLEVSLGKGCTSYDGTSPVAIPSTDYYCVNGFVKMKDTRDNKYYKVTSINSKTWLAENLNYADSVSTVSLKGRSFCYNNKADSCTKYGRLYTWSAVMDSATTGCGYGRSCPVNNSLPVQGICPDGWYVPSGDEWQSLFMNYDLYSLFSTSIGGTDRFGFGIIYAGYTDDQGGIYDGIGYAAPFWSKTENFDTEAEHYYARSSYYSNNSQPKQHAYAVRCIKNEGPYASCNAGNEGAVVTYDGNSYICRSSLWRYATEYELDVNGLTCSHDGALVNGLINTDRKYVCDVDSTGADSFRRATQLEEHIGRGCTSYDTEITVMSDEGFYCLAGKIKIKDVRDNRYYGITQIGSQVWMAENLNYADSVTTPSLLGRTACYPDNDSTSCHTYGRHYTYAAAIDSVHYYDSTSAQCGYGHSCTFDAPLRGVCPVGWHLPSIDEWDQLVGYIGGFDEGRKLAAISFDGYDNYGFGAIAAGHWEGGNEFSGDAESYANFWSVSEASDTQAYYKYVYPSGSTVSTNDYPKTKGFNIRCVYDVTVGGP